MKYKLASYIGAAFTLALATPSAFAALTITNGDFSADATLTNNVTGWFDRGTTGQYWESTWAGPDVSPNGTSVLGLSWNGGPNWAYQSIGTKSTGDSSMTVGFDVGSFTDAGGNRDLGVTFSLYKSDGSFVPADNTDVAGASGITLVGSYDIMSSGVAPGAMVTGLTTGSFDLSGVTTSDALYLRVVNYAGTTGEPWTAVDNITMTVIPEPGAALLGGLGLLALLRRRR
jgi:hypothetical protein